MLKNLRLRRVRLRHVRLHRLGERLGTQQYNYFKHEEHKQTLIIAVVKSLKS